MRAEPAHKMISQKLCGNHKTNIFSICSVLTSSEPARMERSLRLQDELRRNLFRPAAEGDQVARAALDSGDDPR